MAWVEVIVPVSAADVDELSALLVSELPAAQAGVEVRGDEIVFWTSLDTAENAVAETRALIARWHSLGIAVYAEHVRSQPAVPESEWRDAWKRYFHVSRLTRQIVVVPSWETFAPAPDDVVIDLDPGMAFGTGTHASTRLVLEELQRLADDVARGELAAPNVIVDVGAGSGILSIAAVKLWPDAQCFAIDNDPLAVDASSANAVQNGVGDRIANSLETLSDLGRTYPLVLANIQAHVIRMLKADLLAACAPGATLVLSGLLTPQAAPLADEFVAEGMVIVHVRPSSDDPQWSVVALRRPIAS